jgi:two-component system, OmpR family, phosphate regulon sensor histidine kinase PhoR
MSHDQAAEKPGGSSPRRRRVLRSILGAVGVLAFVSSIWSLFRWSASLFLPGFSLVPALYSRELAVYAASLLAFGLLMGFVGRLFAKGKRHDYFEDLRKALRSIAGGDFDVKVDLRGRGMDNPFGQVADDLNDMARALKRMEELRQEFISTVSHDIQSPLTSISGFARALRDEGISAQARQHYLDIIEAESGRLSRLSDNLLRLSALEARAVGPGSEPFRLDEQLRAVVLAAEPQWRGKGLELELELERLGVKADEDMLRQAWANLLHNAIKFSTPGGRIVLRLHEEGGNAIFGIEDEGLGISPEDLPLVFDRFFKADRSRSRADPASGSGLGLAIVKKIVELHGGAVKAESRGLGKGSVFTVSLPL